MHVARASLVLALATATACPLSPSGAPEATSLPGFNVAPSAPPTPVAATAPPPSVASSPEVLTPVAPSTPLTTLNPIAPSAPLAVVTPLPPSAPQVALTPTLPSMPAVGLTPADVASPSMPGLTPIDGPTPVPTASPVVRQPAPDRPVTVRVTPATTAVRVVVRDAGSAAVELFMEPDPTPGDLAQLPGTLAGRRVVVSADPSLAGRVVGTIVRAIRARGAASVSVTGGAAF